jgi:hypothetical protein
MSDFEKLLNQEFKPKLEEGSAAVQSAVSQALENVPLVSSDPIKTILEILFDYYGNFVADPKILKMIQDTDQQILISRRLDDEELDITAAGDKPL